MIPEIIFKADMPEDVEYLDFEGITHDEDGNFYLISESTFRILKVSFDGKQTSWLTPSLQPYGESVELFTDKSAYLEGIAWIANGQFIVCAERKPRGRSISMKHL